MVKDHPNMARKALYAKYAGSSIDVLRPMCDGEPVGNWFIAVQPENIVLASEIEDYDAARIMADAFETFINGPRPETRWFVTIYEVDRAYGGPEEGGWYYECGNPLQDYALSFANRDDAIEYQRWLERVVVRRMNEGRPPSSSVLSQGRCCVRMEGQPPAAYPAQRPHYE